MQYNVSFNRSKVACIPNPVPVAKLGVRNLLKAQAITKCGKASSKAMKLFKQFGEESSQFKKALRACQHYYRSRWLRVRSFNSDGTAVGV